MRVPRAEVTQKGFSAEGPTAANDDDDGWRPDFFPNQRVVCSHGISHTTLTKIINVCCCSINQQCELSFFFIVFFFFRRSPDGTPFAKNRPQKISNFPFSNSATHLFGEREYTKDYLENLSRMLAMLKNWLFSRIFLFSRWMVGYDTIRTYDCGFVSQMSAGAPDAINTWILDCFVFLCTVQRHRKMNHHSPLSSCTEFAFEYDTKKV